MVKSSADALLSILNDILDFSKIEMRKLELEQIPFSIRDHLADLLKPLALRAEQKDLELVCHVLPDVANVAVGDPGRLRQVLVNLVGNAIKFTEPDGSIAVRATGLPDGGAVIEVADTGVGIVEAELPLIFDRFYRGSGANEARGAGSGLGLAIVKSIVDMHHGTIEVESRLGHGSRFVVRLPRDPQEVVQPPAAGQDDGRATDPATDPASDASAARNPKVDDSSPSAGAAMNPDPAPLTPVPGDADGVVGSQPERRSPQS
jgi:signal transduction histidine kinase